MNENWGVLISLSLADRSVLIQLRPRCHVLPAYPVAWLHVAITFLTDVRDQLEEVIASVKKQTNNFKVPIYDIYLPTEADFNRLRTLVGFFEWMFPEALGWPQIFREQLRQLALRQLSSMRADFITATDAFKDAMSDYETMQMSLARWIKHVEAEQVKRKLRNVPG